MDSSVVVGCSGDKKVIYFFLVMSLLGDRHGQIGKLEIMDSDVYLVAKKNSTKRIDLYSKDRKIV